MFLHAWKVMWLVWCCWNIDHEVVIVFIKVRKFLEEVVSWLNMEVVSIVVVGIVVDILAGFEFPGLLLIEISQVELGGMEYL